MFISGDSILFFECLTLAILFFECLTLAILGLLCVVSGVPLSWVLDLVSVYSQPVYLYEGKERILQKGQKKSRAPLF